MRTGSTPQLGAVVLAAGSSRRMGRAKQLLAWGGRTMIADVVARVAPVVQDTVVVTGHEAATVRGALVGFDVAFAHNDAYADGEMISSIKAGVAALPKGCDAFFLVLGDQPGISDETFELLIEAWDANRHARIVSPRFGGRRGHPILLSALGVDEIRNLPADATLKTYVERHTAASLEVDVTDPAVLADVDTPADYHRRLVQETGSATCRTDEATIPA